MNYVTLAFSIIYLVSCTLGTGSLFASAVGLKASIKSSSLYFFVGEGLLSTIAILINVVLKYPFNFLAFILITLPGFIYGAAHLFHWRACRYNLNSKFIPLYLLILFIFLFIPRLFLPNFSWDDVAYHLPALQEISAGNVTFPLLSNSPYLDFQTFFSKFYGNLPFGMESYSSILYLFSFGANSAGGWVSLLNFLFFLIFLSHFLAKKYRYNVPLQAFAFILTLGGVDMLSTFASGYVDISVAIFQFLGVTLLWGYLKYKNSSDLYLSIIFIFTSVSFKYTSLYILPIYLLFVALAVFLKTPRKERINLFVRAFVLSVAFGGFWYIKNLVLYLNPVYPFVFRHFGMTNFEFETLKYQIYFPTGQTIVTSFLSFINQNPFAPYSLLVIVYLYISKKIRLYSFDSVVLFFALYLWFVDFSFGNQISRFALLLPISISIVSVKVLKTLSGRMVVFACVLLFFLFRLSPQLWAFISEAVRTDLDFLRGRTAIIEKKNVGCSADVINYLKDVGMRESTLNFWDPFAAIYYSGTKIFYNFHGNLNYTYFQVPKTVKYLYVNEGMRADFVKNPNYHRDISPILRQQLESSLITKGKLVYKSGNCELFEIGIN